MNPVFQGLTILVLSIVFIGYGGQASAGQEPSSTASSAIREAAQKLVSSADVVSAGEGDGNSEQSEGNEDRFMLVEPVERRVTVRSGNRSLNISEDAELTFIGEARSICSYIISLPLRIAMYELPLRRGMIFDPRYIRNNFAL